MTKNGLLAVLAVFVLVTLGVIVITTVRRSTAKNDGVPPMYTETTENEKVAPTLSDMAGSESSEPSSPVATVAPISQISLTISSPTSGSLVSSSRVTVQGKTSAKAEVFANEAEGVADGSGNFSLSVQLDEGENSIIVTAVDSEGQVAEKELIVTYEVAE